MLLNKHSLTIPARFTGEDPSRPSLSGVRLDDTQTVATDGHCLAMLTHGARFASADFPAVGQGNPATNLNGPVVIDGDALTAIGRALPKPKRHDQFPILQYALVDTERANENETVPCYVTDLETTKTFAPKKLAGGYPNVEQVIPSSPEYRQYLDPTFLAKIGQAFVDLYGKGPKRPVEMIFHGAQRAVEFRGTNPDTWQTLRILAMPMRGDRKDAGPVTVPQPEPTEAA